MSKHNTVTVHGEIEYETVVCTSCENEVPKDTARRMVIGEVVHHADWPNRGCEEYEFKKVTIAKGWACEYCAGNPAQVPR